MAFSEKTIKGTSLTKDNFKNPPVELGILPFWFWNGEEALAKIWQRALKGYVIDSMLIGANSEVFSKEDAEKLVAELKEKDCIVCPSAGLGEDWRFDSGDIAGSALVLDGQGIHLCAFSNGGDSDRPELFSGLGSPGWR